MSERGSLVLVALPGDYGKPRPALVIQSNVATALPSVVVCPLTTTMRPELPAFRVSIAPSAENGLREPSQVMVDKPVALSRDKIRDTIGRLDAGQMAAVTSAIALLLDIA